MKIKETKRERERERDKYLDLAREILKSYKKIESDGDTKYNWCTRDGS